MARQMTDPGSAPTHEQIAARAYEIFIERGRPQGHDLEHWLEAEAQLRAAGRPDRGTPMRATRSSGHSRPSKVKEDHARQKNH